MATNSTSVMIAKAVAIQGQHYVSLCDTRCPQAHDCDFCEQDIVNMCHCYNDRQRVLQIVGLLTKPSGFG